MAIYSKAGILFLIQIDHLSGEVLGDVFDKFYEAGAQNVQCLSSVTKKNRPSYVILIDSNEKHQDKIERIIITHLGSTGWHKIETDHRHIGHHIDSKEIKIIIDNHTFTFDLEYKVAEQKYDMIRPEVNSVLNVQKKITNEAGCELPFRYLYQKCQIALLNNQDIIELC